MDQSSLLVEFKNGILYIQLNRPKNLNALNIPTIVALDEVFDQYQDRADLKGVILSGSGEKAFAAGADIAEFSDFSASEGRTMSANGHKTLNRIEDYPKPVIAAVNGYALGGGCELAMACHIRVATDTARFGQPEVNLGIIPGYGGTQRLVELIGKGRALEMILTGDIIKAETALDYGLVNHIVPAGQLIEKAEEIVNKISKKGPLAIAACIKLVNCKFRDGGNVGDAYKKEVEIFGGILNTEDFKEGTGAFLEKREAKFEGK